jgi:hypothetical protein
MKVELAKRSEELNQYIVDNKIQIRGEEGSSSNKSQGSSGVLVQ